MRLTSTKLILAPLLLAGAGIWWLQQRPGTPAQDVYTHVLGTKTLRCGYVTYEPWVIKNPNTGRMSGIMVEYFNAIGARLGLRVEWPTEVVVANLVTDLNNRRIDAMCEQLSPLPEFAKAMDFTPAFGHLPYYTYVRADAPAALDVAHARFAAAEGFIPMVLTQQVYPGATLALLPQNTSVGELFDQLKYRKADAVVHEALSAQGYIKNNPGVIRQLGSGPIATKDMFLGIKQNEPAWAEYLAKNFALKNNPENQRLMLGLMKKYGLTPDMFMLK